jgi:hypothetical protein
MKKSSLQKVLVISGMIILASSPFLVYFGTRFYVYDIHNCGKTAWSFCWINEIQAGVIIALALFLMASAFFVIAVLKKK